MRRRSFLAVACAGLVAGCSSDSAEQSDPTDTPETATPTETPTPTATDAPPAEFELVNVTAPETVEIGDEVSYSFTVRNVGGQQGTFSTTIRTRDGAGEWSESEPWTRSVPAGATATLQSQSFSYATLTSTDFEISTFDRQFSIQAVAATREFGQGYTVREKYTLIAAGIDFRQAFSYSLGGYEYTKEPAQGKKWAFLTFYAENVSNASQYLPTKRDIALIAGDSQFEYVVTSRGQQYEGGDVQPDIVREGDIIYEVPEEVSKSDLQVAYSETTVGGEMSIRWA